MRDLMLCMAGTPEQAARLPEIRALGAGIELGSYGLSGVLSPEDWEQRLAMHQALRAQFDGRLAIHGPFLGMEFAHRDYLIREAVERRLDMTFDAAVALRAARVNLHSGYTREVDFFQLHDLWLERNAAFWQAEIRRWRDAGIQIVLENDVESAPDWMVRLVDAVDDPALGLCLDTGHQNVFSDLGAPEWVRRMGRRLYHVHLHDNDGTRDSHWPLGRGTIDFAAFFQSLAEHAPQATLAIEVEDTMDVKLAELKKLLEM